MEIKIGEEKLISLIERAFLNGICEARIAQISARTIESSDFKKSAAYFDTKMIIESQKGK